MRRLIDRFTDRQFNFATTVEGGVPEFLLVHDRHDGSCWLWRYAHGLRFLEAKEPGAVRGGGDWPDESFGADGAELPGS